jgi:hypothetical protein
MADEQNKEEGGVVERLRNSPRTVSTIIVILIIAGAIFAFSDKKQNGAKPSAEPTAEEPQNLAGASASPSEKAAASATAKPKASTKEAPKATPLPEAKETAEAYVEVAQRGQSVTKLARIATKRYIEANSAEKGLSNEQKIYVEDYLKDQIQRKPLAVGAEVTFSKDAVRKGIEASKKLSDAQLKNLQKYARNVNWN